MSIFAVFALSVLGWCAVHCRQQFEYNGTLGEDTSTTCILSLKEHYLLFIGFSCTYCCSLDQRRFVVSVRTKTVPKPQSGILAIKPVNHDVAVLHGQLGKAQAIKIRRIITKCVIKFHANHLQTNESRCDHKLKQEENDNDVRTIQAPLAVVICMYSP